MKKLLDSANHYIKTSDWKLIAVLKFCLISLGLMIGLAVKDEHKKIVFPIALIIFLVTYIPLMSRFCKILKKIDSQDEEADV